jgi:hypothetical protein
MIKQLGNWNARRISICDIKQMNRTIEGLCMHASILLNLIWLVVGPLLMKCYPKNQGKNTVHGLFSLY